MQPRLLSVFTGLAMAAFAVGPGSANATLFNFGDSATVSITPACTAGLPGGVCGAAFQEVATPIPATGEVINVNGFLTAAPPVSGVGNTHLTLKPLAGNGLSESGFGVQNNATNVTTCTDPDCEIAPPNAVVATAGNANTLITDALIGSVQAGESFQFWVQTTSGGAFTQLDGAITNACSFPGGSVAGPDLCRWDAPAGTTRSGVAVVGNNADVLLTQVSTLTPAVPEPASLALLGSGLTALGLLRRRRKS